MSLPIHLSSLWIGDFTFGVHKATSTSRSSVKKAMCQPARLLRRLADPCRYSRTGPTACPDDHQFAPVSRLDHQLREVRSDTQPGLPVHRDAVQHSTVHSGAPADNASQSPVCSPTLNDQPRHHSPPSAQIAGHGGVHGSTGSRGKTPPPSSPVVGRHSWVPVDRELFQQDHSSSVGTVRGGMVVISSSPARSSSCHQGDGSHSLHGCVQLLLGSPVRVTVAYIKNEGGTQFYTLMQLTLCLLKWCNHKVITLVPIHLPGVHNIKADSLSRVCQTLNTEWTMAMECLRPVLAQLGEPQVDLFATFANRHLIKFASPYPDPRAEFTDAMSAPWDNGRGLLYAFRHSRWSLKSCRRSFSLQLFRIRIDPAADPHIKLLIRAFRLESPVQCRIMPKWDLHLVLMALMSLPSTSEVGDQAETSDDVIPQKWRTMKTVFWLALASARRHSYLHVLSVSPGRCVSTDVISVTGSRVSCQEPASVAGSAMDLRAGYSASCPIGNRTDALPCQAIEGNLWDSKRSRGDRQRLFIHWNLSIRDIMRSHISRWIRLTHELIGSTTKLQHTRSEPCHSHGLSAA